MDESLKLEYTSVDFDDGSIVLSGIVGNDHAYIEFTEFDKFVKFVKSNFYCRAQKDGDCDWKPCPQLSDDEPEKTGRPCPLDKVDEEL